MIIIIKKVSMFSSDEVLLERPCSKMYLESVELVLTLLLSVEELQLLVHLDLKNMSSAECYHHATKYICQNKDVWEMFDSFVQKRLDPWIVLYRDKAPFDICTLLSQKDKEVDIHEMSALLWSLVHKGGKCPSKIYQYAYHRCRYLFRQKCITYPYQSAIA